MVASDAEIALLDMPRSPQKLPPSPPDDDSLPPSPLKLDENDRNAEADSETELSKLENLNESLSITDDPSVFYKRLALFGTPNVVSSRKNRSFGDPKPLCGDEFFRNRAFELDNIVHWKVYPSKDENVLPEVVLWPGQQWYFSLRHTHIIYMSLLFCVWLLLVM